MVRASRFGSVATGEHGVVPSARAIPDDPAVRGHCARARTLCGGRRFAVEPSRGPAVHCTASGSGHRGERFTLAPAKGRGRSPVARCARIPGGKGARDGAARSTGPTRVAAPRPCFFPSAAVRWDPIPILVPRHQRNARRRPQGQSFEPGRGGKPRPGHRNRTKRPCGPAARTGSVRPHESDA